MSYIPLEKLIEKSNNSLYKLVILSSRRALELAEGAPALIESESNVKNTTVALKEIAEGKVKCKKDWFHIYLVMKNINILLGVTGSIAAYKSCDLIRRLQVAGFSVDVIMTKEAKEFISPLTLQAISQRKVYLEMFDINIDFDVEHIELAKRAKMILIAPATANIIGKLANGIYDDLLTCVVAATKSKVVIAPAMNENMYTNSVVQENIRKLRKLGVKFIGPRTGKLVCGDVGIGCLEEVDKIVKFVKKL